MTTALITYTDRRIRDAILQQLAWDSQVDAGGIAVTARNGAVTLTGFIDSYAGKLAAERAAKRVRGVRAVANDIQVRLRLDRTDADIAADAAQALLMRATLPESVQAVVHAGHVKLTGTVSTLFQRGMAETAVRSIRGVKGIANRITLTPGLAPENVRGPILRALRREAALDADGIEVSVDGGTVTLTGRVRAWHEREAAERAAMHAPGITRVDNRIEVVWPEELPDFEDEICCDRRADDRFYAWTRVVQFNMRAARQTSNADPSTRFATATRWLARARGEYEDGPTEPRAARPWRDHRIAGSPAISLFGQASRSECVMTY